MNNAVKLCIAATLAVLFIGCGGKTTSYVDSSSREYVSKGLDYHDLEMSAKKLVDNFLETYGANADGSEVLEVGEVINDTMQDFDVEQLTEMITTDLQNAKKYQITSFYAGSGGRVSARKDLHKNARDDEEIDQRYVAEKGSRRLADFTLEGKITEKVTRLNNKTEKRDYVLSFRLTNLQTGLRVWSRQEPITKVTK